MLKRFVLPAAFLAITLLGVPARAQQGPTPEQQQMFQQMRDMRQQMMQNMQDKGIDPQQFFQEMGQQIQAGTLDPADLQQYMLDKGVMTQDMVTQVTQMQTTMQSAQLGTLQQQLKVSDDDWKLLKPKIQKVLDAMAALGIASPIGGMGFGGGGGFGGGMGGGSTSEVGKAIKDMRTTVRDAKSTDDDVKAKLAVVRDARTKAKGDLATAQKDLIELLTPRQEAVLTNYGIIP